MPVVLFSPPVSFKAGETVVTKHRLLEAAAAAKAAETIISLLLLVLDNAVVKAAARPSGGGDIATHTHTHTQRVLLIDVCLSPSLLLSLKGGIPLFLKTLKNPNQFQH